MKIKDMYFYPKEIVIGYCLRQHDGSETYDTVRVVYDRIKNLRRAQNLDPARYCSVSVHMPVLDKNIVLVVEKANVKKGILEEKLHGVFREEPRKRVKVSLYKKGKKKSIP